MKKINELLTSEQRAIIECAEGILARELETRLIAGQADSGLGLNSGTKSAGSVHKTDKPR